MLASCRSAYAAQEGSGPPAWSIGNSRVRAVLEWGPDTGFRAVLLTNATTGREWAVAEDFALIWNGRTLTGRDARAGEARALAGRDCVRLAVELKMSGGLSVCAHYECAPDAAVIQKQLEILPEEPGVLSQITPLGVRLALPGRSLLRWIGGVQRQGGWTPESGEYGSFRLRELELGEAALESGPRSTWQEVPWFVLGDGEGLFAGLQYAGRWRARARREGDVTALSLGFDGFATDVEAGARWLAPKTFFGVYAGDLDAAAEAQHRFYRGVLSPERPPGFPWVQYNTWFSHFCDYDEVSLGREADLAAALGVEVFYVDAGWWEGNPRHGANFSSGLGNWRENREKFPSGLRAFADGVRDRGMRFGLWVEPERVDLRTATTGTWLEEWLALEGGRYVRAPWPADTETALLCFGSPEVRAWAIEWIARLVEDLELAWLKWDSNHWGVCTAGHHGHGAADGEYEQLAGVQAVLDALRARFPQLIIENCAGGGTRMDFAMAEHSHLSWISDASEPSHRVRFHLAGGAYAYPPETLNAWICESELERLDRPLPRAALDAIFRSRMLGAYGVSCRLGEWPEETREALRSAISEYKTLRPALASGRFYHLLPQPALRCPDLPTPAAWEAYQVCGSGGLESVVLIFRGLDPRSGRTIPLRGLKSDSSYTVREAGGATFTAGGRELMMRGIRCALAPLASALFRLECRDESDPSAPAL